MDEIETFDELKNKYSDTNEDIHEMLQKLQDYTENKKFRRDFTDEQIKNSDFYSIDLRPDNCVDMVLEGLKAALITKKAEYNIVLDYVADTVDMINIPLANDAAKKGDVLKTHEKLLSTGYYSEKAGIDNDEQYQDIKNTAYKKRSNLLLSEARKYAKKIENWSDFNKIVVIIKESLGYQKMALPVLDKSEESQNIVSNAVERMFILDTYNTLNNVDITKKNLSKEGIDFKMNKGAQERMKKYEEALNIISNGGSIDVPKRKNWLQKLLS